jgi:hypothetical protein
MTIKTQGGKVITKGGKVSCECCGGEVSCCIYSARALANSLYDSHDLPDSISVNGTSFERSGTSYGNTTNGVILEGSVWAKYNNGLRTTNECLFRNNIVDEFANSFLLTVDYGDDFITEQILNRVENPQNPLEILWFADGVPGLPETEAKISYLACNDDAEFYDESEWYAWYLFYGTNDPVRKSGNQNSPIGSYAGRIVS